MESDSLIFNLWTVKLWAASNGALIILFSKQQGEGNQSKFR